MIGQYVNFLRSSINLLKGSRFYPFDNHQKTVIRWYKARGDQTLRLDYDLNENSLVLDLGGYEGQWTADIFSRYRCVVHVFEPVPEFAENIKNRFRGNDKIHVHDFGLSDETKGMKLSMNRDGSSIYKHGGETREIRLVKFSDFLAENRIAHIDLLKINIEGGEYDLLDHIIGSGTIRLIENLQVQFHNFVPGARGRMARIQKAMAASHHLTYQYLFVWENWKKNAS